MRTSTVALAALLGLAIASAAGAQAPPSMPISGPPDWTAAKALALSA